MANEPIATQVTPAPAAVEVAPLIPVVSPAIAPVASQEPVQTPAVVEAPVVTPTVETPPATVVEATEAPAETALGAELDKDNPVETPKVETPEVKAEEANKTPDGVTKTEEGQSAEPAPPPTYDPFKAPEGITLDETRVGEFTGLLAELELSGKADHTVVQEFGQKALDFHISEVNKATSELTKFYQTTWEKQKTTWKDQVLADPEIGGNRFETSLTSAKDFIRTHGGTPEQQVEFRNLMETSGLGNHPAMIRLLANAGSRMSEGKPLAASKPAEAQKSKTETMYGKRR